MMPDVTINIEIYCDRCGDGLCNQSTFTTTRMRREPSFRIEPCKKCLEAAKQDGYSDGFEDAKQQFGEE